MRKLYVHIFFFITATNFLAQQILLPKTECNLSLQGKVIDEHDKSALELATIYIKELNTTATSDENGNYEFKNICPGIYNIKINHFNCQPLEEKIVLTKNTVKNFFQEHHANQLNQVEVSAKKIEEQSIQIRNDVSAEKLNQSKGQSLGEALKNITGVTTLNTGNSISKPIIHGMHSNRVLVINNGIRQEGQQWGIEHAPEVDPFIANKISVIKGANSVRYGSDAIAGVILVEAKPMRDSAGISGEVNLVGMSNGKAGTSSACLEGKFNELKAFSWRVQGTLKQYGTVSAPNYILINTGSNEYNFSYALGWKKENYGIDIFYSQFNTTLGIFGASHIGNLSDLKNAFKSEIPLETGPFTYEIVRPFQHIEHELFKAKSYLLTGENGKLSLTYARQYNLRYEYDKHRPLDDSLVNLDKPDLQFELTSHSTDLIWEHNSFKHFNGSIGVSGITQGNTYEGRVLIPNFRSHNGGIFMIERWRKNRFELEGGVRYDYRWMQIYKYQYIANAIYELISPIHKFENITGNLGAIFKKDSTLNISLNFGSAWRAPSVNELYSNGLHHGAAALEFGNNKLQSERTNNIIFTTRYTPSKKLMVEISTYYHYITNFIYRKPSLYPIVTIHGAFPSFNYTQTDASLLGCDFYLNYKINKQFEITSKASLLRAWDITENNWLMMMPSDRYEAEIIYRFKKYKKINSSYLSASTLFVTKQWRVPANSDFAPPPREYFLFNIHSSCSFKIKNQNIELGFSIFNLLNQTYRDYLDRFRYFTDAIGKNYVVRLTVPLNILINNKSIKK